MYRYECLAVRRKTPTPTKKVKGQTVPLVHITLALTIFRIRLSIKVRVNHEQVTEDVWP